MDVLERIERGEITVAIGITSYNMTPQQIRDRDELLRLAGIGQQMQWVDGVPPGFGPNECKWIIFEHLTPFTRAIVYGTAVWLGKYYSEEKVKLARRWALLPIPPLPDAPKEDNHV